MSDATEPQDEIRKAQIAAFRLRSGNFNSSDPLTCMFYLLLRDHMSAGDLENIVKEATKILDGTRQFTNGWLGQYAQDMAIRIYQAGEKSIKP
jgi:hypothetical protein